MMKCPVGLWAVGTTKTHSVSHDQRSPFIVLLFLCAGHQSDHDGAVLGSHGNTVLMDLKSKHKV